MFLFRETEMFAARGTRIRPRVDPFEWHGILALSADWFRSAMAELADANPTATLSLGNLPGGLHATARGLPIIDAEGVWVEDCLIRYLWTWLRISGAGTTATDSR